MSYIGNNTQNVNYVPAVDYFNGDGSTVAFTLSRPVASVAAVQAVISNVPQNPGSAFTVSGSTITFTSAPPSGTANIYVYYTSPNTQVVQPGQGTVGTTQLQSDLTLTNPTYTGTLTGGTGVVNIGSGQVYKDSSGNVGIGTSSPGTKLNVYTGSATNTLIRPQNTLAYADFGPISDGTIYGPYSTPAASTSLTIGTSNSNPIRLYTNGSERMRIDSSGNVGIGTSSPTAKLHTLIGAGSSAGLKALNTSGGGVQIYTDSTASNADVFIESPKTGVAMAFMNGGSERMRIDSSGNLLVGKTSADFSVAGTIIQPTGEVDITRYQSASLFLNRTFDDGYLALFYGQGTNRGGIAVSGSTIQYNSFSDYRLKENIQPMQNALGVVAQLNPVTYTWKADGSDGQGFIAHELQAVIPDAVNGEKDAVDADGNPAYQGIDTSFLVATLTKAIQELNAKVEAQAAEIAALKGQA